MSLLHEMKVYSQETGISIVQQVSLPGFAQHSSITSSTIISRLSLSIAQMLAKGIKQYLIPAHASAILSSYVISTTVEIDRLWDRFNAFKESLQDVDDEKKRQIERLLMLATSHPHLVMWREPSSKHPPKNTSLTSRLNMLLEGRARERLYMYKHGLILSPLDSHIKFYRTVTAGREEGIRVFPISSSDDKRAILFKCALVDDPHPWSGAGKTVSAAPEEAIEWIETWVFVIRWLAGALRHPEVLKVLGINQKDVGWIRDVTAEINGNDPAHSDGPMPQLDQIEYRQIEIGGKKVFVS